MNLVAMIYFVFGGVEKHLAWGLVTPKKKVLKKTSMAALPVV